MDPERFSLYGNTITPAQDRKALEWQQMFVDQFDYDPDEVYELSVHDNPYLGDVLGIRDVRRDRRGFRLLFDLQLGCFVLVFVAFQLDRGFDFCFIFGCLQQICQIFSIVDGDCLCMLIF